MKTKRHLLLVLSVLALLAIPTAVVFAKELGALTITGPGIKGELTVSDPKYMMNLEKSGFFDQAVLSNAPKNLDLDAGYSITAHLNLDGKAVPYAQMVYYPLSEGQPGYMHYTARMQGDTLQTVDEWNILSRGADDSLRSVMTANNITLESALVAASVQAESPAKAPAAAEPVTVPPAAKPALQTPYTILVIAAVLMVVLGAGLVIRRRSMSPTS